TLDLLNRANDWRFEHAYWGRVAIVPEEDLAGTADRASAEGQSTADLAPERSSPGPAARDDRPWSPLFNGKDLTGWKLHRSQPGHWRVQDGVLVGSGPEVSHLYSERGNYQDFRLRVEARINQAGNSGVYGRASYGPVDRQRWPAGYEAAIDGTQ